MGITILVTASRYINKIQRFKFLLTNASKWVAGKGNFVWWIFRTRRFHDHGQILSVGNSAWAEKNNPRTPGPRCERPGSTHPGWPRPGRRECPWRPPTRIWTFCVSGTKKSTQFTYWSFNRPRRPSYYSYSASILVFFVLKLETKKQSWQLCELYPNLKMWRKILW